MKVKVCGLSNHVNSSDLIQLGGIDFIGFIFYEKSARYTEETLASDLKKIGVFVNPTVEFVLEMVALHHLFGVQLHGDESVQWISELPNDLFKIKAFGVETMADFQQTKGYEGAVDAFLFDTKSKSYGGTGLSFDWSILASYSGETPFFLSGGIGPDDASQLKQIIHPQFIGVDINSKFETAPTYKDKKQVQQFIQTLNS